MRYDKMRQVGIPWIVALKKKDEQLNSPAFLSQYMILGFYQFIMTYVGIIEIYCCHCRHTTPGASFTNMV